MVKKVCIKCNIEKDLSSSFYQRVRAKDGHENTCIMCRRSANALAHKNRYCPNKRRYQHLLKTYQIDETEYERMLTKQDFRCAICGSVTCGKSTDKYFAVDHCHKTGKVRGLLCHPCNTALGSFKENVQSLRQAIDYLECFNDA
jgi:hypothetical protein